MTNRPSDPLDIAQEVELRQLEAALTVRKPEAPQFTGACLFCEEPVEPPKRWCNPECRDLWEKRQ